MTAPNALRRHWPARAINHLGWRAEFGRLVRYGFIGALTAIVYFGTTMIGVEALHFRPVAASVLGQIATFGVGYYGHSLFSFRIRPDRQYFWRFAAITVVLFAINILGTYLLAERLAVSYRVTMVAVAVAVPLASYLGNRLWVFVPRLPRSRSASVDTGVVGAKTTDNP